MKANLDAQINMFLGEGLTAGLSEIDKMIMLSSLGLGSQVSSQMAADHLGVPAASLVIEVEESVLAPIIESACKALLASFNSEAMQKIMELTYEKNCALIGEESAKKLREHHKNVSKVMTANVEKLVSDAEFRSSVAQRTHVKILN